MSARLVNLYEDTRHDAQLLGRVRLRLAARNARRTLAEEPLDELHQVRVVALEQELRERGLLREPSLPQRPETEIRAYDADRPERPRRRVPASMVDRFRRLV